MNRRHFLKNTLFGTLSLALPPLTLAAEPGRTLVMIELKGGNDGLNTLIPFADPVYRGLRPNLGIPREDVIQLTEALGLHPALAPIVDSWNSGEMAIIQGLGYPEPNRSHFRSIDIWDTGSGSGQVLRDGWIRPLLIQQPAPVADGVVLGNRNGPLTSPDLRTITIDRPRSLLKATDTPEREPEAAPTPALAHILRVEEDARRAVTALKEQMGTPVSLSGDFPQGAFGNDLRQAAQIILSGLSIPVIKLELSGFDTHTQQKPAQQRLLQILGEGVAALRKTLMDAGLWDQALIMTYSEFGRRVAENGSAGTDHGTAAPHFVWGKRVFGGLYGEAPSLARLDEGDLSFTTDYRSLYQTLARNWFGDLDFELPGGRFPVLDFLG